MSSTSLTTTRTAVIEGTRKRGACVMIPCLPVDITVVSLERDLSTYQPLSLEYLRRRP